MFEGMQRLEHQVSQLDPLNAFFHTKDANVDEIDGGPRGTGGGAVGMAWPEGVAGSLEEVFSAAECA